MARDFFIAPMIGTGTRQDPLRPKVPPRATFNSACNEARGQCLVLITGDTSGATNDGQLLSLISGNMNAPVSSLSNQVRTRIQSGLTSRAIPLVLTNYATVRDFLQALGEVFEPEFKIENFWIDGS